MSILTSKSLVIRNQAAKAVREAADAIIAQRVRQSKGWDKGRYRDDDTLCSHTVEATIAFHVEDAMRNAPLACKS